MPRSRKPRRVDPELVAAISEKLDGFGRKAARAGVPFEVYEAQLWALLRKVKEELLAEHAARASSRVPARDPEPTEPERAQR